MKTYKNKNYWIKNFQTKRDAENFVYIPLFLFQLFFDNIRETTQFKI